MNDKQISNSQGGELEQIFRRARQTEPELSDADFTQQVMSRIASQPAPERLATRVGSSSTSSWIDLAGLAIGVAACASFVDPAQLLVSVSNALLPGKLILSPLTVLGASLTMGMLAFSGWWAL